MMIFYFYLVHFTFPVSYSVIPFHLVYVFQFLHLFFVGLSQEFIKWSRKAFIYIYIMYNMYFREFINFCLAKKIFKILIPLI